MSCARGRAALSVATRLLLARLGRRWNVVGRVLFEEPVWLEQKPDVSRRHHRIVFRPRNMRVAHGVPEHHVRVGDGAVLFGPPHQALAALALIGMVARTEALIFIKRRDPHVMVHESSSLAPPGIG